MQEGDEDYASLYGGAASEGASSGPAGAADTAPLVKSEPQEENFDHIYGQDPLPSADASTKQEGGEGEQGEYEEDEDDEDLPTIILDSEKVESATSSGTRGAGRGGGGLNTSGSGRVHMTWSKPGTSLSSSGGASPGGANGGANKSPYTPGRARPGAQGKNPFELDIDSLEDKPWRKPNVDITDYFNYGFTEETWKAYCQKQVQTRLEQSMQGRIRVWESAKPERNDMPAELLAVVQPKTEMIDLADGSKYTRPGPGGGRRDQDESAIQVFAGSESEQGGPPRQMGGPDMADMSGGMGYPGPPMGRDFGGPYYPKQNFRPGGPPGYPPRGYPMPFNPGFQPPPFAGRGGGGSGGGYRDRRDDRPHDRDRPHGDPRDDRPPGDDRAKDHVRPDRDRDSRRSSRGRSAERSSSDARSGDSTRRTSERDRSDSSRGDPKSDSRSDRPRTSSSSSSSRDDRPRSRDSDSRSRRDEPSSSSSSSSSDAKGGPKRSRSREAKRGEDDDRKRRR